MGQHENSKHSLGSLTWVAVDGADNVDRPGHRVDFDVADNVDRPGHMVDVDGADNVDRPGHRMDVNVAANVDRPGHRVDVDGADNVDRPGQRVAVDVADNVDRPGHRVDVDGDADYIDRPGFVELDVLGFGKLDGLFSLDPTIKPMAIVGTTFVVAISGPVPCPEADVHSVDVTVIRYITT
ncbi:hypothetical protein Btru_052022 [Bulinus truncatus]|nr:hypothetical protein Btru_052022 [Bulinus truncatus]